ncbi:MAG: hypothetical protein WCH99_07050 [Verrucomicrobiota bacterium]
MGFIPDTLVGKQAVKKTVVSFEFFPPRTADGGRALLEKHIPALLAARPDFIITRLFFDPAGCFQFRDYAVDKSGVRMPAIPGVAAILGP